VKSAGRSIEGGREVLYDKPAFMKGGVKGKRSNGDTGILGVRRKGRGKLGGSGM